MGAFEEAARFAADAHEGMVRKGEVLPYLIHPFEVAAIAASMTTDVDVLIAALLHDTVEEASVTLEELEERFGARVAALVDSESEDKHAELPKTESWNLRKKESLEALSEAEDTGVQELWLADKLANLRSFARMREREGEAMWDRFNQKDPERHEWYYRSVLDLTENLSHTWAWREYAWLVNEMFGEAKSDD